LVADKFFRIERTSSEKGDKHTFEPTWTECDYETTEDEEKVERKNRYVAFWGERKVGNKLLFIIYRIMRLFIVSVFYYQVPYLAATFSYIVPWYNGIEK